MSYKRTARISPTYSSVQHKQFELTKVKLKSASLIQHALFCYKHRGSTVTAIKNAVTTINAFGTI